MGVGKSGGWGGALGVAQVQVGSGAGRDRSHE